MPEARAAGETYWWEQERMYADMKPRKPAQKKASPVQAWRQAVEAAFAGYASMTVFPEPPAVGICKKASCSQGERKLAGVRVPDRAGVPRGECGAQDGEVAVAS